MGIITFHSQNRTFKTNTILNPEDILLETANNYMWINSQVSNLNLFTDGGGDWVTSYINIANTSETFLSHAVGESDRPFLLYNHYGTYEASRFLGADGYSGITIGGNVSLETAVPYLPNFTTFIFTDINVPNLNLNWDVIYENHYGAFSSSEYRRILVLMSDTHIAYGESTSPFSGLTILDSTTHGLTTSTTALITFDGTRIWINNELKVTVQYPSDDIGGFGNYMFDYKFFDSNINTTAFPNNLIESIGYPRILTQNERGGISNWFNDKYSIW